MRGEGTEAALRGLDLATGARSLSGSVKPGTRRRGAACPAALPAVAGKMFKLYTEAICPAHAPVSPEVVTLCVAELHGFEMCRTSVDWMAWVRSVSSISSLKPVSTQPNPYCVSAKCTPLVDNVKRPSKESSSTILSAGRSLLASSHNFASTWFPVFFSQNRKKFYLQTEPKRYGRWLMMISRQAVET